MKSHVALWLRLAPVLLLATGPVALVAQGTSPNQGFVVAEGGEAVRAATSTDPRYTPEGVRAAFEQLARNLGLRVVLLNVDTAEFPYLVHGLVADRRTHHELRDGLARLPGYAYVGSATCSVEEGRFTAFALNLTPTHVYPREQRAALGERMMSRLVRLRDTHRQR